MPWFRNLVQLSTTTFKKQSSLKPGVTLNKSIPYLLSHQLLLHFSTATPETVPPKNGGGSGAKTSPSPTPFKYAGLGPTMADQKPRVVVLGSGWAGCRLLKDIDTNIYDVVCVSPRNHMVFTPLLASTCVGTLEFRSVAEPIGRIQPAISREPGSFYFLANSTGVDFQNHLVFPHSLVNSFLVIRNS